MDHWAVSLSRIAKNVLLITTCLHWLAFDSLFAASFMAVATPLRRPKSLLFAILLWLVFFTGRECESKESINRMTGRPYGRCANGRRMRETSFYCFICSSSLLGGKIVTAAVYGTLEGIVSLYCMFALACFILRVLHSIFIFTMGGFTLD
jgi:hypothetical protein